MDLVRNRKAYHNYHVQDKIEAGIVLVGTEVKSCRAGKISLLDAYARVRSKEVILYNSHIDEYTEGNRFNHDARRPRKLLFHKSEIRKLAIAVNEKGLSLIPLAFYLKNGKVKVSIGLCKGKTKGDKRENVKEKEAKVAIQRAMRR